METALMNAFSVQVNDTNANKNSYAINNDVCTGIIIVSSA